MNKPFFPLTAREELANAVLMMQATPREIAWLYIRAAYAQCDRKPAETARRLGMHRRTVHRMLASKRPTRMHP